MKFDPRLTPVRPDLAAEGYARIAISERYVTPVSYRVHASRTYLRRSPSPDAPIDTELLFGEEFSVLEVKDGWLWGQSGTDFYVGYARAEHLANAQTQRATHAVQALHSQIYAEPSLKSEPLRTLSYGSLLRVIETTATHARIGGRAWVPVQHLAPVERPIRDWVAEAEKFLDVPYVWGGRSSLGLDCSALVQLARLSATGWLPFPRDSDMQEKMAGTTLSENAVLERGDLIFWKGHVGIMADADTLLHANAHHMAVTMEPLTVAVQRIEAAGDGNVTRRARLALT